MTTQPTSDLGPAIDETIKFVWLDEDGNQVSPTHTKIRSALNFVVWWRERFERVANNWGGFERVPDHLRDTLTKTGKPPVRMEQRIIRTYAVELTDAQQALVDTYTEELKEEKE